jgi:hypothetical protein
MIFKELHKNVFHVKNVFPMDMFLRVGDEFNPINNHWTFDKESSYDDGNSSIRGKLVKSSSFMGDNLVLIDIGMYVKLKVEKHLRQKLKLIKVNTNIQYPGMYSTFHKDGPLDNPSDSLWTFVIFCQTNWNTIWGGEFCCNVGDDYVYVPYIPNTGCLFDCRNDHTGNPPNNLTSHPRLSLAYTFLET